MPESEIDGDLLVLWTVEDSMKVAVEVPCEWPAVANSAYASCAEHGAAGSGAHSVGSVPGSELVTGPELVES